MNNKLDIPVEKTESFLKRKTANNKLAMSILVRDECDVIESNIRFHAAAGVDCFIVTDNASVDGTRERLIELAKEFQIELIDEPSCTIDQDLWVTRMAECARDYGDVDWIIHNDADEFWRPLNGNLKTSIQADLEAGGENIGVLRVPRYNFVASREQAQDANTSFDEVCHRVERTLVLSAGQKRWHDTDAHILLRMLPGKVLTKIQGLQSVDMGNHGARHAMDEARSQNIVIHHYPVRSYAQFESKVRNYGQSLASNKRFGPRVSRHLRYWYECYLAGELHQEFTDMHLPLTELQVLLGSGQVCIDESLKHQLCGSIPEVA